MVSKLFFLIAVILFVLAALNADVSHAVEWGLASTAFGLLLEGYFPNFHP